MENYREVQMNIRIYLHVPYDEKDEAKELGCIWDPDRRKWYCKDSDKGKSNVSKCIEYWNEPEPYKIINDEIILLSNIPELKRGFTT